MVHGAHESLIKSSIWHARHRMHIQRDSSGSGIREEARNDTVKGDKQKEPQNDPNGEKRKSSSDYRLQCMHTYSNIQKHNMHNQYMYAY